MNLLSNEIKAMKILLNVDFVTFSNRKNSIFIEYCVKGQNATVKIQSKKSLLKGA